MKYPIIVCIDGTDGSGKKTIVDMLYDKYTAKGLRVVILDFPVYESLSGQLITKYLRKGPGDIRSRKMISSLYSMDRNMVFMDHFEEIFCNDNFDVVLYNRSWLANLFYQTTLRLQTEDDDAKLLSKTDVQLQPAYPDSNSPDCVNYNRKQMTLFEIKEMTNKTGGVHASPMSIRNHRHLENLFLVARIQEVREMMETIFNMEISPWLLSDPDDPNMPKVPFTLMIPPASVVLVANPQVIQSNMDERYQGDQSLKDRSESSNVYLDSVIENIRWIHSHMSKICGTTDQRRINLTPKEMSRYPFPKIFEPALINAFQYQIVDTIDPEGKQLSIDKVFSLVEDQLFWISPELKDLILSCN